MVKVGFAIAGALSGVIIAFVGFNPDLATTEQESAVNGLHAFFCFFPLVGTLIAMYIMRNYSIDETRANEIRQQIKASKAAPKSLASYYKQGKLKEFTDINFNNSLKGDVDFSGLDKKAQSKLFKDTLAKGLHGLCFSPYREHQSIGHKLSEAQIKERMDIVGPHTQWIRSFSCTNGNEFIPKAAKAKGLNTMVGAWIGVDAKENQKEINALIKLVKNNQVDIAVVGNETLMRDELSEAQVIDYIAQVKKANPKVLVGYVDAYYQFIQRPKLVDACDVILINCYPFWEGSTIESSTAYLKEMYEATRNVAKNKPVIISETGWPNQGESVGSASPTASNAAQYFVNVNTWAQEAKAPLFYFSSFDESWKVHHEGDVGARWGIWDKNEKLKY